MTTSSANYLTQLHQLLNNHFNLAEIEDLCFRLGIDYESVPGAEKPSRIRALLLGLGRNGRLPDLIAETQKLRPRVEWPPLPDGFELPKALETAVSPDQYHIYGDNVQGDKFTGDKIGRDKNVVGDVSGQSAVAVGERAQATINQYGDIIIRADNFEDLPPAPGDPPYKGLAYFATKDKDIFFGREKLSDELADRLQTTHFLAIMGASGSGKSSLLRAGIIPRLEERNWRIHIIKPGVHPLAALAASLTRDELDPAATDIIGKALATNADTLHKTAAKLVARAHAERFLLAVDQFEELFTQCRDPQEQQAFVDNLVSAAQAQGAVTVLLSMRADFYGRVSQFHNLPDLISQQQVYIKPMIEEDLIRAIAEPAKRGGWQFVEGLVEQFVADVGNEPGRLPLLSHALLATWERRRGVVMTLGGYREAGGVKSAIAQTAEATYAALTASEQLIAKRIFLRLTELGKGTEDTRRRMNQVELGEDMAVQAVTQRLTTARLITTTQDGIDVAHEALIREWPRLRAWLDADREGLIIHRRLTDAEREWRNNGQEPSLLYSGFRLNEAEQWIKDNPNSLNDLEQAFFTASIAERQKREADAEAKQLRELEQAEKLRVALVEAQKQTSIAQSRLLTNYASTVGHKNGMRALLLAIEAGNQATTTQAFTALHTQLPFMPVPVHTLSHDGKVKGAAWNDNESLILSWSGDTAVVWDGVSGEQLHTLSHEDDVRGAAWNDDGNMILTWSDDEWAGIWDAVSGKRLHTLSHADWVDGAAWNDDGNMILTWSDDKTVGIWDAANGERLHTLSHEDEIRGAAWNDDKNQILTWSDDTVLVWNATSGKRLYTFPHEGTVNGPAWNNDKNQILTWNNDSAVVWDVTSGKRLHTLLHEDGVHGAAWNDDGSLILTWSGDWDYQADLAIVWDAASGERLHTLSHEGWVHGAAWNDDKNQILTWSDDTVLVWNATSGKRLYTLPHKDKVNGPAWNNDKNQILTWSDDTAIVWDTASSTRLHTLCHESSVSGAAWNDDKSLILSWSDDNTAVVWNAASGGRLHTLSHEGWVKGAAWNDDESLILSWSSDNTAVVWNATSGKRLHTLSHERSVWGATWNDDGNLILSWSGKTTIVWDAVSGERLHTLSHELGVLGAAWNGDESLILSRSGKTAIVWDAASGERLHTLSHKSLVPRAVWNDDESLILTRSWDGTAVVWDAVSGERLHTLFHKGKVNGAVWNDNGSQILTWDDNTAVVWDAASNEQLHTLSHKGKINGAAWNDGQSLILTWSDDNTAIVWNAVSGERLHTLSHKGKVNGAVWNDNGSQILKWDDNTAVIWDVTSGKRLQTLSHEDKIRGAAWNDDGNLILTWSDDGTVKIWNAQMGFLVHIITPDGTRITTAQWNQNEDRLLVATKSGIVRIYYTNMDELLTVACQSATRNFNWNEWQLYFPGEPYRKTCPNLPPHPSVP